MKSKTGFVEKISLERIYRLFELAEENSEKRKRYIELARELSKRNKVKIPVGLRKNFCKNCNSYLNEKNSEVETTGELMQVKCFECGKTKKINLARHKD